MILGSKCCCPSECTTCTTKCCSETDYDYVMLICNSNSAKDDEWQIELNGVDFGNVSELGIDRCQGKFFYTDKALLDFIEGDIFDEKSRNINGGYYCGNVPLCCLQNTFTYTEPKEVSREPFNECGTVNMYMIKTKQNFNNNYGNIFVWRRGFTIDESGNKRYGQLCSLVNTTYSSGNEAVGYRYKVNLPDFYESGSTIPINAFKNKQCEPCSGNCDATVDCAKPCVCIDGKCVECNPNTFCCSEDDFCAPNKFYAYFSGFDFTTGTFNSVGKEPYLNQCFNYSDCHLIDNYSSIRAARALDFRTINNITFEFNKNTTAFGGSVCDLYYTGYVPVSSFQYPLCGSANIQLAILAWKMNGKWSLDAGESATFRILIILNDTNNSINSFEALTGGPTAIGPSYGREIVVIGPTKCAFTSAILKTHDIRVYISYIARTFGWFPPFVPPQCIKYPGDLIVTSPSYKYYAPYVDQNTKITLFQNPLP